LELTGNKGYVAVWSSSDESIVTVDKNGKITELTKEGTAIVTAKFGNIEVKCIVTVKHRWTGYF
jgi:uncharacterized protein YjdB